MNFITFSSQVKCVDRRAKGPSTPASASRLDSAFSSFSTGSTTGLCGEACALEPRDAPIRIRAQLGRESVQGLERALDRGAVGGGLRRQEANPRQGDIEGGKPPTSSPVDD